jgi:Pin2-interacting protein X1
MSILAEPRRKQKISVDPQNVSWHKNQDKFGQKMMEKMGWQSGKGLGRMEQGMTQNLTLKANHTAKGLGCERRHDKTWMVHHDEFETLLASLNEKDKNRDESDAAEKISIEDQSKKSKSRIHYHRFARGKDLSRCTDRDKTAILGTSAEERETKKAEKKLQKAVEEKLESNENTTVSQLSVSDYFAAKMAKFPKLQGYSSPARKRKTSESSSDEKVKSEDIDKKEKKRQKKEKKQRTQEALMNN